MMSFHNSMFAEISNGGEKLPLDIFVKKEMLCKIVVRMLRASDARWRAGYMTGMIEIGIYSAKNGCQKLFCGIY